MFYPVHLLKKGGKFYLCWVADSWPLRFATITHRQLQSQDIRKICDDIMEVVINESGQSRNRFSLRLSSQLMRGLVRLYQRKTTVFLSELCVLNAHIMKNVNKKLYKHETTELRQHVRPSLLQIPNIPEILILDEQETGQILQDLIQKSGNVVSNIQDITLKESAIPEQLIPVIDGFGEETLAQVTQLVGDRTLEVMLKGDSVALQQSGLELPLDVTGKSQDRTRPPQELQMERISEHDITMFGKEIPEIPDIPLPDLPVPQMTKLVTREQEVPLPQPEMMELMTYAEMRPTLEIQLEDLDEDEIQPKRRKLKNKLIIDKRIIIPGDVLRARTTDITVELRCQDSVADRIEMRLPSDVYFRRPCHAGRKITSNINWSLTALFQRNLGPVSVKPLAERTMEIVMARAQEPRERTLIEPIQDVSEPVQVLTEFSKIPPERDSTVDITKEGFLNGTEIRKSVVEEDIDISNLLTQQIKVLSQQSLKRSADKEMDDHTIQRKRSTGYITFKRSQEEAVQGAEKSVLAMLQDAGLDDIQPHVEKPSTVVEKTQVERSTRHESEGSETPLGSLDRTKVSLGESDQTTDFQRFLRDQWGTQGTIFKIINSVRAGQSPITVETLLVNGPVLTGYRKVIAARCFTSLLKLKQHNFIKIEKVEGSLEIADVTLTSRVI